MIADPLQVGDEMRGQYDGDPVLGHDLHEHLEEFAPGQWVQTGNGFVEKQEIGPLGDGEGEGELGPLAPGQGPDPLTRVEVESLDACRGHRLVPGGIQQRPHAEMLGHGQPGIGGRVLSDEPDTGQLQRIGGRGAAEHGERARRRSQQPDGQMQERRLPRPVRSDQADDLSFGNGEGAVPERPSAPVSFTQSLGLEDGGHATPSAKALRNVVR